MVSPAALTGGARGTRKCKLLLNSNRVIGLHVRVSVPLALPVLLLAVLSGQIRGRGTNQLVVDRSAALDDQPPGCVTVVPRMLSSPALTGGARGTRRSKLMLNSNRVNSLQECVPLALPVLFLASPMNFTRGTRPNQLVVDRGADLDDQVLGCVTVVPRMVSSLALTARARGTRKGKLVLNSNRVNSLQECVPLALPVLLLAVLSGQIRGRGTNQLVVDRSAALDGQPSGRVTSAPKMLSSLALTGRARGTRKGKLLLGRYVTVRLSPPLSAFHSPLSFFSCASARSMPPMLLHGPPHLQGTTTLTLLCDVTSRSSPHVTARIATSLWT